MTVWKHYTLRKGHFKMDSKPCAIELPRTNLRPAGIRHADFCAAGQPAPCPGYFSDDILPCVCGATGDVFAALELVALPMPLAGNPPPRHGSTPAGSTEFHAAGSRAA